MINKRPIPEHDEAFELYFNNRSVDKTAKEMGKHRVTMSNWKRDLKWDERIVVREKQIHKTGKHVLKYPIESYRGLLDTITLKLKVNDSRLKVLGDDLNKHTDDNDGYVLEWDTNEDSSKNRYPYCDYSSVFTCTGPENRDAIDQSR